MELARSDGNILLSPCRKSTLMSSKHAPAPYDLALDALEQALYEFRVKPTQPMVTTATAACRVDSSDHRNTG